MAFDLDAIKAAAESARRKSRSGSNVTDQLMDQEQLEESIVKTDQQVDLSTNYLGLSLGNPVVASAGPLSQTVDGIRRLEDGGVGAVVLFSLFEEQIRLEQARQTATLEQQAESFAEALSYFPTIPSNDSGKVGTYLQLIEDAASKLNIPLIASLNSSSSGDWATTARQMQDAGASAIELNIYFVAGNLNHGAQEVEQLYVDILQSVKQQVSVPVAVKLAPYFSSFGAVAKRLVAAGADGLVLFNRWLQPDIDLDALEMRAGFNLSTPDEGKLARSWISALYGETSASLAGTTGVETSDDVVKYILSGADVVMTTAALIRHGADYANQLVEGLSSWLTKRNLSLAQARGLMVSPHGEQADLYARSGYLSGLEQAKQIYGS